MRQGSALAKMPGCPRRALSFFRQAQDRLNQLLTDGGLRLTTDRIHSAGLHEHSSTGKRGQFVGVGVVPVAGSAGVGRGAIRPYVCGFLFSADHASAKEAEEMAADVE